MKNYQKKWGNVNSYLYILAHINSSQYSQENIDVDLQRSVDVRKGEVDLFCPSECAWTETAILEMFPVPNSSS